MPFFRLVAHRYILVFMGFFGNFFNYCMRLTINMAIIQMVRHPASKSTDDTLTDDTCPVTEDAMTNSTAFTEGDFEWDSNTENMVLGSFYYGYLISQIPAGFLADRFSPKILFGVGMGATGVFTLLAPVAAWHGYESLVGIRVLQGLAQGVCFPLMPAIFGRWAPPQERTTMVALNSAGTSAGTVFVYTVCGVLGANANIGWEGMFYCFGSLGLIFTIPWMLFVHDSPERHPTISAEEKSYIISSIGAPAMGVKSSRVPWLQVFKSPPFWALIVMCWCSDWGFYTLLSDVPLYLKDNLHFSLKQNSQLSAVPYAIMMCVVLALCPLADIIINRHILSVTNLRKITTIVGCVLPGLLLIGIPYVGCSREAVIALLSLSIGLTGIASLGFRVNFNDISPSHAGLLYAICNTLSTSTGFIGPIVTGILTTGDAAYTISAWRGVFVIAATLYFFAAVVYGLLASGELQNWDSKQPSLSNRIDIAPELQLKAAGVDRKAEQRRRSLPPWIPPPTVLEVAVPETDASQQLSEKPV